MVLFLKFISITEHYTALKNIQMNTDDFHKHNIEKEAKSPSSPIMKTEKVNNRKKHVFTYTNLCTFQN